MRRLGATLWMVGFVACRSEPAPDQRQEPWFETVHVFGDFDDGWVLSFCRDGLSEEVFGDVLDTGTYELDGESINRKSSWGERQIFELVDNRSGLVVDENVILERNVGLDYICSSL